MQKIKGGFILKPKRIKKSKIYTSTPCTREVWDWLLMNAEHKDGKKLKRGQLFLRYKQIIEGLTWYVGYRKMTYSDNQIKTAMHNLRADTNDGPMVTTTKTPAGVLITICNYDKYQTLGNYVGTNEATNETTNETTNEATDTPIKGRKEERKKETTGISLLPYLKEKIIHYGYLEIKEKIIEFFNYRQSFPKAKRYKSEKGINGLFRHISSCRDSGLNVFECLEITMEEGWQTPNPEYFKKNRVNKQDNGFGQIEDACQDFVKNFKTRGERNGIN